MAENEKANDDKKEEVKCILDQKTAASGLCDFGWNAEATHFVYRTLELPNKELSDISLLERFLHLQNLNLCHNKLIDVSAINHMQNLLDLNLSHNKLYCIPTFPHPKIFLKRLDLSYNEIKEIRDMCDFKGLDYLNLSGNKIEYIEGLCGMDFLKSLNLQGNAIKYIENLNIISLRILDLSYNCLTSIDNLQCLKCLLQLDLSYNSIKSLSGLQGLCSLTHLNLEKNLVMDLSEICKLIELTKLEHLNLKFNPVCDLPKFRPSIILIIPLLITINQEDISIEERVDAEYLLSPPIEYTSARNYITNMVYNFFKPQRLLNSILPDPSHKYPVLILVGPQGMGKVAMAIKLSMDLPCQLIHVPCHTTRLPCKDEINEKHYYFVDVEDFECMTREGSFMATYSINKKLFGFGRDAFEEAAGEKLAIVASMELEGALTMNNGHLKPIYVLFMPSDEDSYERRLLERNCYEPWEVEENLKRFSCLYRNYMDQEPSFFHAVITGDDLVKAYEELKKIVSEYLEESDVIHELRNPKVVRRSLTLTQEPIKSADATEASGVEDEPTAAKEEGKANKSNKGGISLMEQLSLQSNFTQAYKAVSGYSTPIYDRVVESLKLKNLNRIDPRCSSIIDASSCRSKDDDDCFEACRAMLPRKFSISTASVRNFKTGDVDDRNDISTQTQPCNDTKRGTKNNSRSDSICKDVNYRACASGEAFCIAAPPQDYKGKGYAKKKLCLPAIKT